MYRWHKHHTLFSLLKIGTQNKTGHPVFILLVISYILNKAALLLEVMPDDLVIES